MGLNASNSNNLEHLALKGVKYNLQVIITVAVVITKRYQTLKMTCLYVLYVATIFSYLQSNTSL